MTEVAPNLNDDLLYNMIVHDLPMEETGRSRHFVDDSVRAPLSCLSFGRVFAVLVSGGSSSYAHVCAAPRACCSLGSTASRTKCTYAR